MSLSAFSFFNRTPLGTGMPHRCVPGAIPSPGRTIPTLSAGLWRRVIPALWSSLWPYSRHAPTGPCLCWGSQGWIQNSRWGLSRVMWQNPLPWPPAHFAFDAVQGVVGILDCKHWCFFVMSKFSSREPPSRFWQNSSQWVLLVFCTRVWECPDPGAPLCTWTCWTI